MKIAKLKVVSVISALAGLLVYPRPSAARATMPAPNQKAAQQTTWDMRSGQRSAPSSYQVMTAKPELDANAIFKTTDQLNAFLQSPAMQGKTTVTTEDVLNYLMDQLEQLKLQQ